MRNLSCLTKKEQKIIANWLSEGVCDCPFHYFMEYHCDTCATVFPECKGKTALGVTYISCPCNKLTYDYVISELGGLLHD